MTYILGLGFILGCVMLATGIAGHRDYRNDSTGLISQGVLLCSVCVGLGLVI